jgi:hypothetical protein
VDELEVSANASTVPVLDEQNNTMYEFNFASTEMKCGSYTVWCLSNTDEIFTSELVVTSKKEYPEGSEPIVCLSGDTLITLADRSTKRLDAMHIGDEVYTKDGISTVTRLGRGIWRPLHTLYYFEDGTMIDETNTHRFYNVEQGFWQKLKLWNIGEHALSQNGENIALVKVEVINEEAECFGLWTANGQYYANSLLSGSADANVPLLDNVTLERAADMITSLDEEEIEKMFFGGVL